MCYTRLLAPTHEKKSRKTEGSVRPVGTLSPGLDDSFSDASSFISESVCSTLTDLNADQGKSTATKTTEPILTRGAKL